MSAEPKALNTIDVLSKIDCHALVATHREHKVAASQKHLGFLQKLLRVPRCRVLRWPLPSSEAEIDQHEKELENVRMNGDEDPELFFVRSTAKYNMLLSTGKVPKSERSHVRLICRNLLSIYSIGKRTHLSHPNISMGKVEEIIKGSYANRKCDEQRDGAGGVGAGTMLDPHALGFGWHFSGQKKGGGAFRGAGRGQEQQAGQERQQQHGGEGRVECS